MQSLELNHEKLLSSVAFDFNMRPYILVSPVGLEGSETKEAPPNPPETTSTERKSGTFELQQSGAACARHFPGLSDPAVRAKLATNLGREMSYRTNARPTLNRRIKCVRLYEHIP